MKLPLFGDVTTLAISATILACIALLAFAWQRDRGPVKAMKQFARYLAANPDDHDEDMAEHMAFVKLMDDAEAAPPPQSTAFPRLIDDLLATEKRRYRVADIRLR